MCVKLNIRETTGTYANIVYDVLFMFTHTFYYIFQCFEFWFACCLHTGRCLRPNGSCLTDDSLNQTSKSNQSGLLGELFFYFFVIVNFAFYFFFLSIFVCDFVPHSASNGLLCFQMCTHNWFIQAHNTAHHNYIKTNKKQKLTLVG